MVLAFAHEMNFLRTVSQRFTVRPWAAPEEKHLVLNRFCPSRGPNYIIIFLESSADFYNSTY